MGEMNGRRLGEIVTVPVGKLSVDLYSRGDRICDHIKGGGRFEPDTLKLWGEICSGGGLVIDVGSYTGLYGIAAAKHGCTACLFEPMPNNLARIRQNTQLNGVEPFVNACAISDREGITSISWNSKVKGLTSGASLVMEKGDTLKVRSATLDSMEFPNCRAIKVDVERAEAKVLTGSLRTIKTHQPLLIIEVLDAAVEGEVRAAMNGLNYKRQAVLDVRNWVMVPA